MHLVKLENGHYIPYSDMDYDLSKKVAVGKVVKGTLVRNPAHHRKAMAILNIGFENQDKIESFDVYRKVITIISGFYDNVPGKNGNVPIAKSLNFATMSQLDFNEFYSAMVIVVANDLKISVEELENNKNNI